MEKTAKEITVEMIHPQVWENDHRILAITDPIPIEEWLEKASKPGRELEILPYDSLIAGGRYDGGHVVGLHMDDDTFLFTIPPEAIPLLQGLLTEDEYFRLLERTPGLADIAATRNTKAPRG